MSRSDERDADAQIRGPHQAPVCPLRPLSASLRKDDAETALRFPSMTIYLGPRNCAVSLSIAPATSRHCASQLLGKRNVRSAPSTRRSLRHMPGRCGIAGAARDHGRRAGDEQVFIAVRRAVAERAHRQAVLLRRQNLVEIARIDGADADVRRQRVVMRGDRQEDAVDRLDGCLGGLGADVLGRAGASSEG